MFELSALKAQPFACEFKPNPELKDGEGVQLKINLDFLTIERIDALNQEVENRVKSLFQATVQKELKDAPEDKSNSGSKKAVQKMPVESTSDVPKSSQSLDSMYFLDKEQIRLRAIMLGGEEGNTDPTQRLIYSWDVVHQGKPVPVSYEVFAGMSKHMQQALYNFVTEEAQKPTKKKSAASESI